MKIHFNSIELQTECNCFQQLVLKYGVNHARRIRQRIDELVAAHNLADFMTLPAPKCQLLNGKNTGQLSIETIHPFRILLKPTFNDSVHLQADSAQWASITELIVLSIETD